MATVKFTGENCRGTVIITVVWAAAAAAAAAADADADADADAADAAHVLFHQPLP